MLRVIVMGVTVFINFILQTTVFDAIQIVGVKPNTALLIIISYAILRGDIEGSILGFSVGLLQDIFYAPYIGFYALLGALVGYICGKPFRDFFHESYLLPIVLSLATVFIYEIVYYFFNFMLQGQVNYFYYFRKIILPVTVYTSALSFPVYRIIYGINNKLEKHEHKTTSLF